MTWRDFYISLIKQICEKAFEFISGETVGTVEIDKKIKLLKHEGVNTSAYFMTKSKRN